MVQPSSMRRFLPVVILLAGLVLFFTTGLNDLLNFKSLAVHYASLTSWIDANRLLAWGGFFLLYLVAVAFSLPIASLLTLGGAALLGWVALPLVVVSATAGAFILFLAAQGALQDSMERRAGPFMGKIRQGFNASPFFWLLALRLVPLFPFWVVNIVPALLGMSSRDFLLATLIGIAPGSAAYIWVGISVQPILAAGRVPNAEDLTRPELLASLAVLAGLAVVPAVVRSISKKRSGAA
ncbi:MAG: TVP38/TMEM64 family protein [Candidatus Puniceispirillales bacterium]